MDLLERIRAAKRAESETEMRALPMRRAIELASAAPPPHPFATALRREDRVTAVAEVPAPGSRHAAGASPAATARSFAAAGAVALSVITDTLFLKGSPAHLAEVRDAVQLPVLRKDFVVDEYGLYRSRALGADALLLIARLLEPRLLQTLIGVSRSLHMDTLVEVCDETDTRRALDAGADLVLVNNRDAATHEATLETSLRLAPLLGTAVRVSAGGVESAADVARLRGAGFDAVLLGERLTREADPAEALRRILLGEGA